MYNELEGYPGGSTSIGILIGLLLFTISIFYRKRLTGYILLGISVFLMLLGISYGVVSNKYGGLSLGIISLFLIGATLFTNKKPEPSFWTGFLIGAISFTPIRELLSSFGQDQYSSQMLADAITVFPRYENDGYELLLWLVNLCFYGLFTGFLFLAINKLRNVIART